MPVISFNVRGQSFSVGWLICLLVLIACFIFWLKGAVTLLEVLACVAALAVAYLIG